jgi:6-pyruvoyltetrahydropterin/6-carboxytetrahydropterin synthase
MKKGIFHLGIRSHFDAAHCLREYEGKCANLHGHRWDVEVVIKGEPQGDTGIALDFTLARKIISGVLEDYDHCVLNEKEPWLTLNPTAENISKELFRRMKEKLSGQIEMVSVKVWESPEQWASYGEVE